MMVAIGFLGLDVPAASMPPALLTLHRWLDSWSGIGLIERGMARQGYDLALTRYANEGRRATFYPCERESTHSTYGPAGHVQIIVHTASSRTLLLEFAVPNRKV